MSACITALDRRVIAELAAHRSPGSVSVLLDGDDRANALREARPVAARRLRRELGPSGAATLARLDAVAAWAADAHDGSLALFASDTSAHAVALPGPVRSRVVVDETFATRDIVTAVEREIGYLVAVLDRRGVRLLRGRGDRLVPIDVDVAGGPHPLAARRRVDRRSLRVELDRALDGVPSSPVVVVGADDTARRVCRSSRHRWRIVDVAVSPPHAPLRDLAAATAPARRLLVARREQEALDAVERARRRRHLATGIDEVWRCAVHGDGWLVVVEDGFAFPAVVAGGHVSPADDLEAPETVDDLVDEIIEAVIASGGEAAVVPDGALGDVGGVALVLRR